MNSSAPLALRCPSDPFVVVEPVDVAEADRFAGGVLEAGEVLEDRVRRGLGRSPASSRRCRRRPSRSGPDVGRNRPHSSLASVLLPAPLGPTMAIDLAGPHRQADVVEHVVASRRVAVADAVERDVRWWLASTHGPEPRWRAPAAAPGTSRSRARYVTPCTSDSIAAPLLRRRPDSCCSATTATAASATLMRSSRASSITTASEPTRISGGDRRADRAPAACAA